MYIEGHNHCFMLYFGVKTLSETPFTPPLMHPGYGARSESLVDFYHEAEHFMRRVAAFECFTADPITRAKLSAGCSSEDEPVKAFRLQYCSTSFKKPWLDETTATR